MRGKSWLVVGVLRSNNSLLLRQRCLWKNREVFGDLRGCSVDFFERSIKSIDFLGEVCYNGGVG